MKTLATVTMDEAGTLSVAATSPAEMFASWVAMAHMLRAESFPPRVRAMAALIVKTVEEFDPRVVGLAVTTPKSDT